MAKKSGKRKARRISRAKPMQNMVNTGALAVIGSSAWVGYGNCAHLLSMLNRKAYHQVTRDGHLKNYGVEIQVFNMVNGSISVDTASLAYPTYNATRAWHFARKERYSDAGFDLDDLGYGSRLRFALDKTMSDYNQSTGTFMLKPSHLTHTVAEKGEWDWSDVIIVPPTDVNAAGDPGVEAADLYDSFVLHLCGDHTRSSTDETIKYSHVGMTQSWTENRRGWSEPSAEEVIQPENPLAFARASSLSTLALTTEVADEQKQSPPYSNVDDDSAESVFAELVLQGQLESKFPNPTTNNDIIVAPGGVFRLTIANNDHANADAIPFVSLRIYELD